MRNPIIRLAHRRAHGQHPGLLLQRYLTKDATGESGDHEERRQLLGAAMHAARDPTLQSIYRLAFARWNDSFSNDGLHVFEDLCSAGRLIVGLGSENVLETGIRLHHTYGLPVIPASALKGVASHYCDQAWGQRADESSPAENRLFRRGEQYHDLLFGNTDDGGVIAFHDAWFVPQRPSDGGLMLDVMTPHHAKWQTNEAPPTDFDSPVPVAFLSVSGTFRVGVSWSGPSGCQEARSWTDLAFKLVKQALAEWGVGGKTSSGYGRLVSADGASLGSTPRREEGASNAPSQAKYQRGADVTVTRVADSTKGKRTRRRFQADDGLFGYMDAGDGPSIAVGETASLWVANANPQGYTFSMTQPKLKGKKQPFKRGKGLA